MTRYRPSRFRRGDVVEVRSAPEILATLDERGRLEELPFMPEMLAFCGKRFRVGAVAHKTCDTATKTGGRSVSAAVHLEDLRCDGSAHAGCQAACLLFWKDDWLRPVYARLTAAPSASPAATPLCSPEQLQAAAFAAPAPADGSVAYACQATELPRYSRPLPWWDARQYLRDVTTGNHAARHVARVLFLAALSKLMRLPFGYRAMRALYDRVHRLITGRQSPFVEGIAGQKTVEAPAPLELRPGERVRVRSLASIARTLNASGKHRGLFYGPEMSRYCGQTLTVRHRVTQIIDEGTGKMIQMKNPCIVLDGAVCPAEYSDHRLLCPRAITAYWRELWLEREPPQP